MVRISTHASKVQNEEPVQVKEDLPGVALNELISTLCHGGFVEEHTLIHANGNSKADTIRIAVTTDLLGPVRTPYLMVFEGLLEDEMATLGVVLDWFVKATHSASEEVLHQSLS